MTVPDGRADNAVWVPGRSPRQWDDRPVLPELTTAAEGRISRVWSETRRGAS